MGFAYLWGYYSLVQRKNNWKTCNYIGIKINKKDCVEMMSSLANETHQSLTSHIITFNTNPQIQYEWITKSDVVFGNIPI
jgi:hypothetical protein